MQYPVKINPMYELPHEHVIVLCLALQPILTLHADFLQL